MKTLYLFSRTPNQENIRFLKKLIDTSDCVVFIQNGVYITKQHIELTCQTYILEPDAEARGLKMAVNIVDHARLVELIMEYPKVVTI